jgi:hypothetical protein
MHLIREGFGREQAPAVSSEESGAEIVAKFNGRKTSDESEE